MKKTFSLIAGMLCAGAFISVLASCSSKPEFKLADNMGICGGLKNAAVAKANGLAYVEVGVSSFLIPEASEEEFAANRKAALESPCPVYSANGFYPKDIRLTGPDAEIDRAVAYANTAIRRASELGMKVLVLGSGKARQIPEGFDKAQAEEQFLAILKGMAPAAEKYGITIVIEPLQTKECNFINTVREGAAMARRAESPAICVLADLFHMRRNGEDAGAITESADKLRHCHIAEVENRTAPGIKGDDFTDYLQALKDINYEGRMSFECGWNNDLEGNLPVAMQTMRNQINSLK